MMIKKNLGLVGMKNLRMGYEMSTLEDLKEYLVGNDGDGYLLNDDNDGKTVMLSGAWGSGKTHFWQKKIENDLTKELNKKNKACVYVSLYGKDNIEAIKNEILFKAYESIKDENKLAKRAISAFGFGSRLLSISVGGVRANTGAVGEVVESFFESKKIDEAESFLADGGLICLDDFERKSKHIDLNDLFGFIAQLAIDMNCKIVIILNSDVFEGDEANVFKTVKEKTVNKFFYFDPSIEELFESIYASDSKYKRLDTHKAEILNTIEETEELNARIYIQVLDNCLEWSRKRYDTKVFRELILSTIFFIKYHMTLNYQIIENNKKIYDVSKFFSDEGFVEISKILNNRLYLFGDDNPNYFLIKESIQIMYQVLNKHKKEDKESTTEDFSKRQNEMLKRHKDLIQIFVQYIYSFQVDKNIEKNMYDEMQNFIKTGILLTKDNTK